MLKNSTNILLTLLVNAVLLTFTVVPHHHHGEIICFSLSHIERHDNCDATCHHDAEETEDDTSAGTDCCRISDWVLTHVEDHKHDIRCGCCTGNDNDYPQLTVLFDLYEEPLFIQKGLPFRQTPFKETYLQEFVSCVLGLRAPPVC
ncbi:MAG: hypothetical protein LBQ60_09490 [Bacteroidales bacterium]|jgi:hypothetical protein|nr:hypothetical protein [Bacteroidales bacterium]